MTAGEAVLLIQYDGSEGVDPMKLRQQIFTIKSRNGFNVVHPHELPPTKAASSYQSQVQLWLYNSYVISTNWGWQELGSMLITTMNKTRSTANP